ncbi:MAG: ribonuclease H-like domain-containing protein [Butyrivibrio sp.]|nr:ribonuclease H-like domain-containing protein [Butyrivibrio sp.]
MIKNVKSITFSHDHIVNTLPKMLGCSLSNILFIDIETTGLSPRNSDIYMIGLSYYENGAWIIYQLFAENEDEEVEILKVFAENFNHFSRVINFNGDRFDLPFLKNKLEKYHIPNPLAKTHSVDINKSIRPYKNQLGLLDCKQKTIEMYLGITRADKYDGGKLIPVYASYKKKRSQGALEVLLLHNYEDVKGMFSLLPMFLYEKFFKLFRNMPRTSVRTDEPIAEEKYLRSSDPENVVLPVKAKKVQANYYNDYEGNPKKELFMKLSLPFALPSSLTGHVDDCYFKTDKDEAILRVPLIEAELKYFYSNYKDYYYLPKEDMAIHKSIASFVDKAYREKAKATNCYTKKESQYLREWDLVFTPFFKSDYEDSRIFFELNENLKRSRFAMSIYASHVIAHILES